MNLNIARPHPGKHVVGDSLGCDRGAGSVLVVGLIGSACAMLLACAAASGLVVERAALQSRADQIALTAEDSLRGLTTGFPCELARVEANRFALTLDTCRILNSEAWIVLKQERLGIVMTARAHAGS